jgi:hypothetical protein
MLKDVHELIVFAGNLAQTTRVISHIFNESIEKCTDGLDASFVLKQNVFNFAYQP